MRGPQQRLSKSSTPPWHATITHGVCQNAVAAREGCGERLAVFRGVLTDPGEWPDLPRRAAPVSRVAHVAHVDTWLRGRRLALLGSFPRRVSIHRRCRQRDRGATTALSMVGRHRCDVEQVRMERAAIGRHGRRSWKRMALMRG